MSKYTFSIEIELDLSDEEEAACIKHYQDNWRSEIDDPDSDIPEIPDATNLVEAWAVRNNYTIDEDHGSGITLKWSSGGDAEGGEAE